jgi:hypothetical protein
MKTIKSFCAVEQKVTEHTLDIDGIGEVILTCTSNVGTDKEPKICGHFIKFPKDLKPEQLKELIAKHQFVNEGQMPIEHIEKKKNELIDALLEG